MSTTKDWREAKDERKAQAIARAEERAAGKVLERLTVEAAKIGYALVPLDQVESTDEQGGESTVDYSTLTSDQLTEKLKERNLPHSGNVADKVARLIESDAPALS